MVAVMKRFESGPIKSRVGAFPDVFGMRNGRFKGTESRSEPRVRFRLAAGKYGYYWVHVCQVEKTMWYCRQSGIRREPSDLGGLVMSQQHCRSARKESISIE